VDRAAVVRDRPGDKEVRRMTAQHRHQRDPRRDVLLQLGARVRSLRRERGLTQESLAESLDLSIAYVSLIERGGRNPPFTTVVAIARALGVSPRDICE
jgi:DNA-binding XRE family transcriptional regulator